MPNEVSEILERLQRDPIVRSFAVDREAVNEENRTVELAFASDKPVDHWFGMLCLSMDKKSMRSERLKNGAPLLMDHDARDVVGVVESHSVDKDGIARATVRFGESARAQEIFHDVKTGIRKSVSVGFMVYELDLESEKDDIQTYRSTDWEPFEISIVAIPADISVGVGRSADFLPLDFPSSSPTERAIPTSKEDKQMPPEEIAANAAAEATRSVETTVSTSPALAIAREIGEWGEQFGHQELAREYQTQEGATVQGFLTAVRAADKAKRGAVAVPAPLTPAAQAARQGGGAALARIIPRHGRIANFTGDNAAEKAYRFGQWLMAGPLGNEKSRRFCEENGLMVTRAMSEGVNEKGGFLVPDEFGNDLIDLREVYGVFRREAKIVPMTSETRSDPRRAGGLTAYFVGEAVAGTLSDLAWDRVELVAKKLMVLTRYSSELNEDSIINLGDTIAGEIAYAFAQKEDDCGFNGDGTSTYGGIVGVREKIKGLSGTIADISGLQVATGNLYSEIVLADFIAMMGRLPVYADSPRAKFYMHKSVYWNIAAKLVLAAGGVTGAEIEGSRALRLLGYDVEFVQVMPSAEADSQVVALFGDLSLAASFGSRRDTTIAVSEHSRFANDEIEMKGTERFDINVHSVGNASATAALRVAGPIVGLITANA